MRLVPVNWRTTAGGFAVALGLLSTELAKWNDIDPATNPDWGVVFAAFGMAIFAWCARDKNVTSEEAGAK